MADEAQKPLRLFDSIPEAVADITAGKLVVVLDNEDRENEGDLIMTGEHVRGAYPVQGHDSLHHAHCSSASDCQLV